MRYSRGRCTRCGERLYGRVDGGYVCSNCGREYGDDHFGENEGGGGDGDGGRRVKLLLA